MFPTSSAPSVAGAGFNAVLHPERYVHTQCVGPQHRAEEAMRAVLLKQFGDPKTINVEDVPTPEPKREEALVEVRAAAINPSDVKNVTGAMHGTTLPRVPGRDFA